MTLLLDFTIGGASANSYQSLADIDSYAEAMSPSDAAAWAAIETDAVDATYTKTTFAVRATRILDTIPFPGSPVTITQALMWPRYGVEAPVVSSEWLLYGAYYPTDSIPAPVRKAQAQLAVYLAVQAAAGTDPFGGSEAGVLSALRVGPIGLTFRPDASSSPAAGRDYLEREIYPILVAGNCAGAARGVRLTR